ncbi:hypothetical protein JXR93_10735 [bacterium]|nr:hypothetical protein [bacterium]
MIYLLYIVIFIAISLILSIILIPIVDNSVRFSKILKKDLNSLKKIYPLITEEIPNDFFYKVDLKNMIFKTSIKLFIGGESDLYFELVDARVKSILVISKFDGEKWLERMKSTYIKDRKESFIQEDSKIYGPEIYHVFPKRFKSKIINEKFKSTDFDFGITHHNKFFSYFF